MGRKRDLGVLLLLVALVGIVGRWLSEPVHLDSLDLTVGDRLPLCVAGHLERG